MSCWLVVAASSWAICEPGLSSRSSAAAQGLISPSTCGGGGEYSGEPCAVRRGVARAESGLCSSLAAGAQSFSDPTSKDLLASSASVQLETLPCWQILKTDLNHQQIAQFLLDSYSYSGRTGRASLSALEFVSRPI